MAPRASGVRVDGLAELLSALDALPDEFGVEVADAIDTGSAIIESEAHGRVPYDEGDLDRSIGRTIRADGMEATVGSGLVYAPFVELGTIDTSAQPYLYPAFLWGARYVRKQMRGWAERAVRRVRFRTRRSKRLSG